MPSTSAKRKVVESWREVLAPYGVGYRIKLLSQLLGRKFQEQLEPFGLTPFHWVVLCCLWEEDGLATCSIGEKLQQVGGTLTGVLDRMEERGLIRRECREFPPKNANCSHIYLTKRSPIFPRLPKDRFAKYPSRQVSTIFHLR